tara:strand:+ start:358 stop:510 length:153 start_codon:yes stop_codon:yes gene_type:complete
LYCSLGGLFGSKDVSDILSSEKTVAFAPIDCVACVFSSGSKLYAGATPKS